MTTEIAKTTARPAWASELSDREWLFCESYASELSGVEAALAAGYTTDRKAAREQACRLRKRPHVQDAISRLLAERVGASKARVIDEISSIAFAEPSEAISVTEKLNALALLSKVLGLQVHKTEVSGPGGEPMTLTWESSTARERIAAKLDAIAGRRAEELPAPSQAPIPMERIGDVYTAAPSDLCELATYQTPRVIPARPLSDTPAPPQCELAHTSCVKVHDILIFCAPQRTVFSIYFE